MATIQARTLWLLALILSTPLCGACPQATSEPRPVAALGDLEFKVTILLDASNAQAKLMERTEGFKKLDMQELAETLSQAEQFSYPSRIPAALDARRALMLRGAAAVPVVISELKNCDVATWAGWSRANYADGLLQELALGRMDSALTNDPADPKSVARTLKMIEAWSDLALRTKDVPQFWSGMRTMEPATLAALNNQTPPTFTSVETVMSPCMTIQATTSTGKMTISSDHGFRRSYQWEGAVRWAQLGPMHQKGVQGVHGSMGIYFPGLGDHWEPVNGITRGVLQEARPRFETSDEALAWIEKQRTYGPLVYRNDGLAVSWSKSPSRNQINVDVWQFLIDGKRPTQLPGSNDDALVVN